MIVSLCVSEGTFREKHLTIIAISQSSKDSSLYMRKNCFDDDAVILCLCIFFTKG